MSIKKIYLIDGNSFIYRMFFALPEFSTKEGRVVNATFGMAKFFVGQLTKEKPDYIVFVKDAKGENFRHKLYSEYKATRERMPDSLRSQIGDIEEMIAKMQIDIIEIPGFEADDVIATLAVSLGKQEKNEIFILSGDKDLYALVNEQVKIYDTQKKRISGPEETFEKFGIKPECVRDYLAICGDSSDNIPGIAGIGPKKATVLLNEFGSLENIYEIIDDIKNKRDNITQDAQKILKGKTLEKFIEGRENAFLSQKLATLESNVSLPNFDIEDYEFDSGAIRTAGLHGFFTELEFFSLLDNHEPELKRWKDLGKQVQIIGDESGLIELEKLIFVQQEIVLDTETSSLNPREAELIGISILLNEDDIFYINHLHRGPQVDTAILKVFIAKILESDLKVIGHNLKYDLQVLENFLQENSKKKTQKGDSDFGQISLSL